MLGGKKPEGGEKAPGPGFERFSGRKRTLIGAPGRPFFGRGPRAGAPLRGVYLLGAGLPFKKGAGHWVP